MREQFVVQVFSELVKYIATHDESPSVRDLCIAVGWPGEKEVWWALQVLESIGMIRWPIDSIRNRKMDRGIELLISLKQPVKVPIVGYLNAPADFVPGSRWVEFYEDGRVIVNEGEEKWQGTVINLT